MLSLNVINLIGLILLGSAYLTGLGWLVIGPLRFGGLVRSKTDFVWPIDIPVIFLTGIIMNYGLLLIITNLSISLFVGILLASIGCICFLVNQLRFRNRFPSIVNFKKLFGISLLGIFFLIPILSLPLTEWDARSIWFFHAKMIYSSGSIGLLAGWQDPAVVFSHVDYPNLVPALAAQLASVVGFWNEYIPKLSLFFILIPPIIMIFNFQHKVWSFLLVLTLLFFNMNGYLWNGYMDGFLALYFSLALLFLGNFLKYNQKSYLFVSLICAIFLLYIKNEGILVIFSILPIIVGYIIFKNYGRGFLSLKKVNMQIIIILGLLIIPFLIWTAFKSQWGLSNDLALGSSNTIEMFFQRIRDGSYINIAVRILGQIQPAIMILGLLLFTAVFLPESVPTSASITALITVIYCLGIFVVYLVTPVDLGWHLKTSLSRTMLPVMGGLFVAGYFIFENLEQSKHSPRENAEA